MNDPGALEMDLFQTEKTHFGTKILTIIYEEIKDLMTFFLNLKKVTINYKRGFSEKSRDCLNRNTRMSKIDSLKIKHTIVFYI